MVLLKKWPKTFDEKGRGIYETTECYDMTHAAIVASGMLAARPGLTLVVEQRFSRTVFKTVNGMFTKTQETFVFEEDEDD